MRFVWQCICILIRSCRRWRIWKTPMITTSKKTFPPLKIWKNWVSTPHRRAFKIVFPTKPSFENFFARRRRSAIPWSVLGPEGKRHSRRDGVASVFAERYVHTRRLGQKAVTFLSKTRQRHLHDWRVLRWVV